MTSLKPYSNLPLSLPLLVLSLTLSITNLILNGVGNTDFVEQFVRSSLVVAHHVFVLCIFFLEVEGLRLQNLRATKFYVRVLWVPVVLAFFSMLSIIIGLRHIRDANLVQFIVMQNEVELVVLPLLILTSGCHTEGSLAIPQGVYSKVEPVAARLQNLSVTIARPIPHLVSSNFSRFYQGIRSPFPFQSTFFIPSCLLIVPGFIFGMINRDTGWWTNVGAGFGGAAGFGYLFFHHIIVSCVYLCIQDFDPTTYVPSLHTKMARQFYVCALIVPLFMLFNDAVLCLVDFLTRWHSQWTHLVGCVLDGLGVLVLVPMLITAVSPSSADKDQLLPQHVPKSGSEVEEKSAVESV